MKIFNLKEEMNKFKKFIDNNYKDFKVEIGDDGYENAPVYFRKRWYGKTFGKAYINPTEIKVCMKERHIRNKRYNLDKFKNVLKLYESQKKTSIILKII